MKPAQVEAMHAAQDRAWRTPRAVAAQWLGAERTDPRLLQHRVTGAFWEAVERSRSTLIVTREYEHLVLALSIHDGAPSVSYLPLPHPSGVAFDRRTGAVHVASTRNPNQVFELAPAVATKRGPLPRRPLVPVASRTLPGATYLHDLAMVGGVLHANAVGENAVLRLAAGRPAARVWWPRCIEGRRGPRFDVNHLQLNSIAAGKTLRSSFFTASTDRCSTRRPGDPDFRVDRRGVVFSGATREPVVRGLTRPHSARLHRNRLWVDNSGYGELGVCEDGRFTAIAKPGGWTRGLAFTGGIAWVGTSRVLPRFHQYAPGLDPRACVCGVHAVDVRSGRVLGSLVWPAGNQIFAIEAVPARTTGGLPFVVGDTDVDEKDLFFGFVTRGR